MDKRNVFDAVIVGGGPAGLFAAVEICRRHGGISLCIIDKGGALETRRRREAAGDRGPGWLEGVGGAGFFIGGRLSLDLDSPSGRPSNIPKDDAAELRESCLDLLRSWGSPGTPLPVAPAALQAAAISASEEGLRWQLNYPALHLNAAERLSAIGQIQSLLATAHVELLTSTMVTNIQRGDDRWLLTISSQAGAFTRAGRSVLFAPGRSGAAWLAGNAGNLGARARVSASVGVRVEVDRSVLAPLTDLTPDPRFFLERDAGTFRTYACAVGGKVVVDEGVGEPRIGIQPGGAAGSVKTSFSILWQPPSDAYDLWPAMKRTPAFDPLESFLNDGRPAAGNARTQELNPSLSNERLMRGSLRSHWPDEYWDGLMDFLERLDHISPGIRSAGTVLYSPAIERQWEYDLDASGRTTVPGLYLAGDGAGVSQGAMAAIVSGMKVGRVIAAELT